MHDETTLQELARQKREQYVSARPFPHVAIDDFLLEAECRELLEGFPQPGQIDWIRFDDATGRKLATPDPSRLSEAVRRVLQDFNSARFLGFLETLTGITGLIPDPYFEGGGLHQIARDGFLKVHADFNYHEKIRLNRRINVLLYLNENWDESWGGHLELWDRSMEHCVTRILPVYNRCVVFSTTDWSYHGHPDPLQCPQGITRKSIALYYYTNGRPEEEVSDAHSTLYQHRPQERQQLATRYSVRRTVFRLLEATAGILQKPASAVRILASRIKPPDY